VLTNRFLAPLALGVALGLLIVSGLSCFSCVIYRESLTGHGLPTSTSEFQSYITPECPWVKGTLQGILGDPPYEPSQAGFDKIRDWVANNIDYMADEKRWGEDYWQTPEETLSYSSGDCEDFSTLLCSLLRAYGIDAERVYVALGIDDEEYGHAFLIEDWYNDGEWLRIESQAPASWPRKTHPDSELYEYEINAAFNDLYYYDVFFPWDEN
jgi:predicted transglutaminase-like cysteine proteinase